MSELQLPEPVQVMLTKYLDWLGKKHDSPDDAVEDHKAFKFAWRSFVEWMESRGAEVDDLKKD